MLINVIGWTTCRPFARHQRSRALFLDGTRMPGPPKDSAEAINACMSRLFSAVAWPKKAKAVAYPVMQPARSTTHAVFCWIPSASSVPRSNPCTRSDRALQASKSRGCAGLTTQPGTFRSRGRPWTQESGSRTSKPRGGVKRQRAVVE